MKMHSQSTRVFLRGHSKLSFTRLKRELSFCPEEMSSVPSSHARNAEMAEKRGGRRLPSSSHFTHPVDRCGSSSSMLQAAAPRPLTGDSLGSEATPSPSSHASRLLRRLSSCASSGGQSEGSC